MGHFLRGDTGDGTCMNALNTRSDSSRELGAVITSV